jgi:hypothetical protein
MVFRGEMVFGEGVWLAGQPIDSDFRFGNLVNLGIPPQDKRTL